jgi:hypothetical protein
MTLDQAFPSRYLKSSDLPEEGSQTVTIEKIAIEEIGRDKETKPIIFFEEFNKGLVCNKTNARTIARIVHSEDFDDWVGHKISLYRTEVDFGGELVEAIRVKSKQLAQKEKSVTAPTKKRASATEPEQEIDEDGIPF